MHMHTHQMCLRVYHFMVICCFPQETTDIHHIPDHSPSFRAKTGADPGFYLQTGVLLVEFWSRMSLVPSFSQVLWMLALLLWKLVRFQLRQAVLRIPRSCSWCFVATCAGFPRIKQIECPQVSTTGNVKILLPFIFRNREELAAVVATWVAILTSNSTLPWVSNTWMGQITY